MVGCFAERVSDDRAGRRLARAIEGKGAFRRFKDELHQQHPHLLPAWRAFRDTRAQRRASAAERAFAAALRKMPDSVDERVAVLACGAR